MGWRDAGSFAGRVRRTVQGRGVTRKRAREQRERKETEENTLILLNAVPHFPCREQRKREEHRHDRQNQTALGRRQQETSPRTSIGTE